MKKLVISEVFAVLLSCGLYLTLTMGFGLEPVIAAAVVVAFTFTFAFAAFAAVAAGAAVAAVAAGAAVAAFTFATFAGFTFATFATFAAFAAVAAFAFATADKEKLRYLPTLGSLLLEVGTILGVLTFGGLPGVGIGAGGVILLLSLLSLPRRIWFRLEIGTEGSQASP